MWHKKQLFFYSSIFSLLWPKLEQDSKCKRFRGAQGHPARFWAVWDLNPGPKILVQNSSYYTTALCCLTQPPPQIPKSFQPRQNRESTTPEDLDKFTANQLQFSSILYSGPFWKCQSVTVSFLYNNRTMWVLTGGPHNSLRRGRRVLGFLTLCSAPESIQPSILAFNPAEHDPAALFCCCSPATRIYRYAAYEHGAST